MKNRWQVGVVLGLIGVAVLSRFLPHPPNFSPVMGIALFAGARFSSRRLAIGVPLIAMALSDLAFGWHSTLPFVYLSLIGIGLLGWRRLKSEGFSWASLGGGSLVGAALFFVVTNFGVWLTQDLYSHDLTGLGLCYLAGIPFFPATLISSLVYSFALFSLWALVESRSQAAKA